jgi:DNA uptake protein ComE-like DNA-binding protein
MPSPYAPSPPPAEAEPEPAEGSDAAPAAPPATGAVNLNEASYDDLRRLGLSVTQTGRVLSRREELGRFNSLDDLDAVPGFSRTFLDELKRSLTL